MNIIEQKERDAVENAVRVRRAERVRLGISRRDQRRRRHPFYQASRKL